MYTPRIKSNFIQRPSQKTSPSNVSETLRLMEVVRQLEKMRDEFINLTESKKKELDSVIRETLATLEKVKKIQKGEKGNMPIAGRDFPIPRDGKDGKTIDIEEVASVVLKKLPQIKQITLEEIIPAVIAKIPKPKDGYTPKKGKDYFDGQDSKNPEVDLTDIIEKMSKLPKGKGLGMKNIEGLEQTMQAFRSQITSKGYLHGGGTTVVAGTNIILTKNTDGTTTVSAIGGGGFTKLSPTEVVDGTRKVFTFASAITQPTIVVSDGVELTPTDQTVSQNIQWSWNSGLLQATLSVPPQFSLFAIQ